MRASWRTAAQMANRSFGTPQDEGDREIGSRDAHVRILVVAAREDLEIARQVRELLRRPEASG